MLESHVRDLQSTIAAILKRKEAYKVKYKQLRTTHASQLPQVVATPVSMVQGALIYEPVHVQENKRIRFSQEEEELVRQGLEKFAGSDTIWKDILLWGRGELEHVPQHRFHAKRSAIDIKDKARNLQRRAKKAHQRDQETQLCLAHQVGVAEASVAGSFE